jgi:hypothetical protein
MAQTPYPSALLNELHNLFPAFLYDSQQFQTVPQVMSYIDTQMRRYFDVYSNNRNAYLSQTHPTTPIRPIRRQNRYSPPPIRRQRTEHIAQTPSYESENEDDNNTLTPLVTELILGLLRGSQNQATQNTTTHTLNIPGWGGVPVNMNTWMEPIPVPPSAQVLQTNTTVVELASPLTDNCSICQDSMEPGTMIRSINHCGHSFHRNCIDVWFQSNVRCPTCRHDIRIVSTQGQRQPLSQQHLPSSNAL